MYIAILGRQPAFGIAELERLYGSESVEWLNPHVASVDAEDLDFNRLGSSQKAGRVTLQLRGPWPKVSASIASHYVGAWQAADHKITLGISVFDDLASARDVQKLGVQLKKQLRERGVSLRLIPNTEPALNTAASHHNKLGLSPNKIELLITRSRSGEIVVAESIGAQNITALAARDQARPKTDAFVGMLPPKLARTMVNIAVGSSSSHTDGPLPSARVILDPFCGTGVILQEAVLLGYDAYGTDLSEKMTDYSRVNLDWLTSKYHIDTPVRLETADAITHQWLPPVDVVVAESYLGQPFSAPPSPTKLRQVRDNCNHIISSFLENISRQLTPGTVVCLAVPAWNDGQDRFTHLPLKRDIEKLGYTRLPLKNVTSTELLYYRPGQIVAREVLLLTKA